MINNNKGMYIEELVNKTIEFYLTNNICFLEKRNLPIKIIKKNNEVVIGKLLKKSYVDYFGFIDGKYITFETKQTNEDFFMLSQLKKHQLEHLRLISSLNGISFLILHFFSYDKTYLIHYEEIEKFVLKKKKKLLLNDLIKSKTDNIKELNILFPGILNLYEKIKQ